MIKVGLYTYPRQEEIVHLHKTGVCANLGGSHTISYMLSKNLIGRF